MLRVCVCVFEYSCNCVRVLNVVCVSALLTQQSERAVTGITQFLLKLTLTLRSYVNVMPSSISRCMISQKALNSCSKTLGQIITKTTTHLLLLSSCWWCRLDNGQQKGNCCCCCVQLHGYLFFAVYKCINFTRIHTYTVETRVKWQWIYADYTSLLFRFHPRTHISRTQSDKY